MAHYAHITNGIVDNVIVVEAETLALGHWGDPSEWVQTSYNTHGGVHANGGTGTNGSNATANTGGGGGGGGGTGSAYLAGGNGGSGIVIIRYPANCAPPASTTGLQQVLYNNNYQIYVFTSSGTITF